MKRTNPGSANTVTVLLPARDEAETIAQCVEVYRAHPAVDEVIVVANGCQDETAALARASGATVVESVAYGKGLAIRLGTAMARSPVIVCIDADTPAPSQDTISFLLGGRPGTTRFVKGTFDREAHPGPVTDMLVKPVLEAVGHHLRGLSQPLSGVFACGTQWLRDQALPIDFGVDLHLVLSAAKAGLEVVEVDIGTFVHRNREWAHYRAMARALVAVLQAHGLVRDPRDQRLSSTW